MRTPRYVLAALALWLIPAVLFPATGLAGRGEITPSIMVQSTYDDNVLMRGRSDWETRVTPKVKFEYGPEDWTIKGGGHVALFRYLDLTKYERENYNAWLEGDKDLTERLSVFLKTSFDYDHTFVDELTESGLDANSALRRRYTATPGLEWKASEKDQLTLSLPMFETKYAGHENPDTSGLGSTLGWVHVLNDERTSLLAQGSYNHYYYRRTDGKTYQDVFNGMLGLGYRPSELLDIKGYFGLGYSDTTVTMNALTDKSSKRAYPSFDLSGTYSREKWTFTLGGDRQVSPSIYGESTMRTRGRVSGQYSFTERFSAYCEAAYYQTKSDGLVQDTKTRTYYVRPWLMYHWSEDATLRLEYKYTDINNQISGKTKRQNRIGLRFDYAFPTYF